MSWREIKRARAIHGKRAASLRRQQGQRLCASHQGDQDNAQVCVPVITILELHVCSLRGRLGVKYDIRVNAGI